MDDIHRHIERQNLKLDYPNGCRFNYPKFLLATCQRNLSQLCGMLTHFSLKLLQLQSLIQWTCTVTKNTWSDLSIFESYWSKQSLPKQMEMQHRGRTCPVGARCQVLLDAPPIYKPFLNSFTDEFGTALQQFHAWLPCPDSRAILYSRFLS